MIVGGLSLQKPFLDEALRILQIKPKNLQLLFMLIIAAVFVVFCCSFRCQLLFYALCVFEFSPLDFHGCVHVLRVLLISIVFQSRGRAAFIKIPKES